MANLSEILSNIGRYLLCLGESLAEKTTIGRFFFSFLGLLYVVCWLRFSTITFFVSVTVLFPAEFVWLKYKELCLKKTGQRHGVAKRRSSVSL